MRSKSINYYLTRCAIELCILLNFKLLYQAAPQGWCDINLIIHIIVFNSIIRYYLIFL